MKSSKFIIKPQYSCLHLKKVYFIVLILINTKIGKKLVSTLVKMTIILFVAHLMDTGNKTVKGFFCNF